MVTTNELHTAIQSLPKKYDGFSGNCARFAAVVNRVIGGDGDYVLVDGDHYEFVDHVYLSYKGRLFDADGMTTKREVAEGLASDNEIPVAQAKRLLEDFHDETADGDKVRKLADDSNPLAAGWNEDDFENALTKCLRRVGADLEAASSSPAP